MIQFGILLLGGCLVTMPLIRWPKNYQAKATVQDIAQELNMKGSSVQ
jgi:hypothetical protein